MAQTDESAQVSSPKELDRIVDVGAQIQETPDLILPYVDDDTAAKEFLDLSPNPRGEIYGGPSAFPLYAYKRANEDGEIVEDGELAEAITAEDVDEMREEYGIDTSVVNPTLQLGLSEVNNDRFAVELAKGYNRWLVDEIDDYDGLVGNMTVASQHPEKAAEEIDEMGAEDSIVGVTLPITGMLPRAGHRMYNPIYEAASKHDLPITLKGTVGIKSYHQQVYSNDYYAQDYAYHEPFLIMENLTSLMFEGVPERYPDLDFVVLGSGVNWAPYLIMRLDDHYLELGYEIPALNELPSAYMRESFYWGTAPIGYTENNPTSDYIPKMVQMTNQENVVFSSDIPHPVTDSPSGVFRELEFHFDDDDLNQIFGGTAANIFDV